MKHSKPSTKNHTHTKTDSTTKTKEFFEFFRTFFKKFAKIFKRFFLFIWSKLTLYFDRKKIDTIIEDFEKRTHKREFFSEDAFLRGLQKNDLHKMTKKQKEKLSGIVETLQNDISSLKCKCAKFFESQNLPSNFSECFQAFRELHLLKEDFFPETFDFEMRDLPLTDIGHCFENKIAQLLTSLILKAEETPFLRFAATKQNEFESLIKNNRERLENIIKESKDPDLNALWNSYQTTNPFDDDSISDTFLDRYRGEDGCLKQEYESIFQELQKFLFVRKVIYPLYEELRFENWGKQMWNNSESLKRRLLDLKKKMLFRGKEIYNISILQKQLYNLYRINCVFLTLFEKVLKAHSDFKIEDLFDFLEENDLINSNDQLFSPFQSLSNPEKIFFKSIVFTVENNTLIETPQSEKDISVLLRLQSFYEKNKILTPVEKVLKVQSHFKIEDLKDLFYFLKENELIDREDRLLKPFESLSNEKKRFLKNIIFTLKNTIVINDPSSQKDISIATRLQNFYKKNKIPEIDRKDLPFFSKIQHKHCELFLIDPDFSKIFLTKNIIFNTVLVEEHSSLIVDINSQEQITLHPFVLEFLRKKRLLPSNSAALLKFFVLFAQYQCEEKKANPYENTAKKNISALLKCLVFEILKNEDLSLQNIISGVVQIETALKNRTTPQLPFRNFSNILEKIDRLKKVLFQIFTQKTISADDDFRILLKKSLKNADPLDRPFLQELSFDLERSS